MTTSVQVGASLDFSRAEGRWSRLGSYYAMFPISFVENVITRWTDEGQTVLDPFCGRGTAPFVAMVTGRRAVACDINPVAWLYSKTKVDPHPKLEDVERRVAQVFQDVQPGDDEPEHEFQKLAFCSRVLGFIRSAQRTLDWRNDRLDRTVMTFMIHHLQDKRGQGLSNQLRHSRAMSPRYSINWWRKNGYGTPPEIDPQFFLVKRARWRYAKGVALPRKGHDRPLVALGDGTDSLPDGSPTADLVLTSPPYSGVTNYRSDNWLRLWALGEGPSLPDWDPEQKFLDVEKYADMLKGVFGATLSRTHPDATWYVRSDARTKTKTAIKDVLATLLPGHELQETTAPYPGKTQTALYGDHEPKPGEVDLVFTPWRRCGNS